MKKSMVGLIIGFIIGVVIIPFIVLVVVRLGYAPVATASPPLPFEKWLAHTALKATVAREAPHQCPIQADETKISWPAQKSTGKTAPCVTVLRVR